MSHIRSAQKHKIDSIDYLLSCRKFWAVGSTVPGSRCPDLALFPGGGNKQEDSAVAG